MGSTVKAAVAPVAQAVGKVVTGVKDVAAGNVAKGIGEVGAGYVDGIKSSVGLSADNKFIGENVAKTALSDFTKDPAGSVAAVGEAYVSGGASLIPTAFEAGQSALAQYMGGSPSQVAAGGAPKLPESTTPTAVVLPRQSNNAIALAAVAGLILVIYLRR